LLTQSIYISHKRRGYAIDFAIAGQGAAKCDIAIWLLVIFIYKTANKAKSYLL
jgi:hypothetical protein